MSRLVDPIVGYMQKFFSGRYAFFLLVFLHICTVAHADPAELGLDPNICRPASHPDRVTEYLRCPTPIGTRLSYEELLARINRHLDWLEDRGYPEGLTALNQGDRSRVLNLCNIDLTGGDFERAVRDSVRAPFNRPVLAGSYMPGASLRGVNLRIVDLRASYLHCIDFRESDLSAADLSMSNIDGSDFSGAILRDTALGPSNMQGVDFHSSVFEPSSLMSPNFLNDLKGLRELQLDVTDLSEARLLQQLLEEAGHPLSADDVTFALERAITQGYLDSGASLSDLVWGGLRAVSLGYLLEYGLSAKRVYWSILIVLFAGTGLFYLRIRLQSLSRSRKEIFVKFPEGEPIRNRYGEFELRREDELLPVQAAGLRAIVDAVLISLASALKLAIGPINLAASISDFRPIKLSYVLTGYSRVVAGILSTAVPSLFALSFYY
jgi:uncharacterized protein YjbI with pentapeptide repeats